MVGGVVATAVVSEVVTTADAVAEVATTPSVVGGAVVATTTSVTVVAGTSSSTVVVISHSWIYLCVALMAVCSSSTARARSNATATAAIGWSSGLSAPLAFPLYSLDQTFLSALANYYPFQVLLLVFICQVVVPSFSFLSKSLFSLSLPLGEIRDKGDMLVLRESQLPRHVQQVPFLILIIEADNNRSGVGTALADPPTESELFPPCPGPHGDKDSLALLSVPVGPFLVALDLLVDFLDAVDNQVQPPGLPLSQLIIHGVFKPAHQGFSQSS